MSYGKHHWSRTGDRAPLSLSPDGRCPWCGAEFPVDTLRDQHARACTARPEEDR